MNKEDEHGAREDPWSTSHGSVVAGGGSWHYVHGSEAALSDDKRIVSVRLESHERESHGETPMEAFAGRMSTMARRS